MSNTPAAHRALDLQYQLDDAAKEIARLRTVLEFIASIGLDCPIGLPPEVFYRRQAEGMIANAAAVLASVSDEERP